MYELFAPFDWDKSENRARDFARDVFVSCKDRIPKFDGFLSLIADYMTGYVSEVVRCRGQESKDALASLETCHTILEAYEVGGFLAEDSYDHFNEAMREFVFDELRRCGIGKYRGFFEPVCRM